MEGKEKGFTVIVNDAVAGNTTDIPFGTTIASKDFERLASYSYSCSLYIVIVYTGNRLASS